MRLTALCLALSFLVGCSEDSHSFADPVTLKVMTRNLFLGSEMGDVIAAPTVNDVPALVDAFRLRVLASDFPARAKLIAEEVALENPDILAVQELELFRLQSPSDFNLAAPAVNAEPVAENGDMLAILQAAFAEKGLTFGEPAVVVAHSDVEIPGLDATTGTTYDLRMTDRDAIFVRPGIPFANPRGKTFDMSIPLRIPMVATGYPVPMKRGYAAIDVTVSGTPFTFTATHLEVGSGQAQLFQEGQANELLAVVKKIPGTQLITGDFNSNAIATSTASYGLFAAAFTDAWPEGAAVGDVGPTCCTDIDSPAPAPDTRIDLLFHKGLVKTMAATRTGLAGAHTPSGKLASDHLGAAFTVQLGK